jgi:hypothetical protein
MADFFWGGQGGLHGFLGGTVCNYTVSLLLDGNMKNFFHKIHAIRHIQETLSPKRGLLKVYLPRLQYVSEMILLCPVEMLNMDLLLVIAR